LKRMLKPTTRTESTREPSEVRVRTIGRQHPLILDDPSYVWLVRSGTAEVFSSQVEDGRPVGPRRFLFLASAHDALFTVKDEHHPSPNRLFAVAVDELSVVEIPLERMDESFRSQRVSVAEVVEGWVNNVTTFTSADSAPEAEHCSAGKESH